MTLGIDYYLLFLRECKKSDRVGDMTGGHTTNKNVDVCSGQTVRFGDNSNIFTVENIYIE